MTTTYTKAHFAFEALPWLTSPRRQLDLQGVALGLVKLPANEGYTFTHHHRRQEEVYIVIEGSGTIQLDGNLVDLERGDIIRVSPEVKRALRAREPGLTVICAGAIPLGYPDNPDARYLIDDGVPDYDDVPVWYHGNEAIIRKNNELKSRMRRGRSEEIAAGDPERSRR